MGVITQVCEDIADLIWMIRGLFELMIEQVFA